MPSDCQLLDAWRAGDTDAGNTLFSRHFDSLLRFFFTKVDDPEVEDLIQRTLVACVESSDRFRGDASFRTYLFAVARNELRMHWRRRGRSKVDFTCDSAVDLGTSPSGAVGRSEDRAALLTALRQLTVDQQIIIELHYWEGLKPAQLATLLDVDATTTRTRLHRARVRLRELLEAGGSADAATLGGLETWARNIHHKVE